MPRPNPPKAGRIPSRMTILPDHPILDGTQGAPDGLSLAPKLGSVLDILRHKSTQAPIAIALYGGWGTGKTSAMRWLDSQLQEWNNLTPTKREGHAAVESVWFDPWKYTKREDVWRGLISEIILRCIDAANLTTENAGQRLYQAAKQFGCFLGRSFLHALANAKVKVKAGAAEAELTGKVFQDVYDEYTKSAHPEKAFLNEFESTLKDWVKDYFPQAVGGQEAPRRLAIFIDDLDRCLPEVTLEVLEALKLYLNIPGLLFVVGLDREVVDGVVCEHYKQHGLGETKGRDYLNKMFQVDINIAPTQTEAHGFLATQIEALDTAANGYWSQMLGEDDSEYRTIIESKIDRLAGHNPREIKRLLNSTLLRATAAARMELEETESALCFAQGAQVFLIQWIVGRFFASTAAVTTASLLLREDVQVFFEQWSQFVSKYPNFKPRASEEEQDGILDKKNVQYGKSPKESEAPDQARTDFAALCRSQPRYDTKTNIELTKNEDLWDLMRIPFSLDVAAATAQVAENAGRSRPRAVEARATSPGTKQLQPSDQEVLSSFPPEIMNAISGSLKKPVGEITIADLAQVTELDLSHSVITDIRSLAQVTNIQSLDLDDTQVTDLMPLAQLTNLQNLVLNNTLIMDLTPLTQLTKMQDLNLGHTQVTDLTPLAQLTNLQRLDITHTKVTDLTPLAQLTYLQILDLANTQVTDLTPLAQLTNLQILYLAYTNVTDLTPLAQLTKLKILDLMNTEVIALTPLAQLTNLLGLNLIRTKTTDLTPLAQLTNLKDLELGNTQITNLIPLAKVTSLQILDLSDTMVSDLTPLEGLINLRQIYVPLDLAETAKKQLGTILPNLTVIPPD